MATVLNSRTCSNLFTMRPSAPRRQVHDRFLGGDAAGQLPLHVSLAHDEDPMASARTSGRSLDTTRQASPCAASSTSWWRQNPGYRSVITRCPLRGSDRKARREERRRRAGGVDDGARVERCPAASRRRPDRSPSSPALAQHGAARHRAVEQPARGADRIDDAVARDAQGAREAVAAGSARALARSAGDELLDLDAALAVERGLPADVLHLLGVLRDPERSGPVRPRRRAASRRRAPSRGGARARSGRTAPPSRP